MGRYLTALADALGEARFDCPLFIITSGGGMTTIDTAVEFPIRLVESGPSGGAILSCRIAVQCGLDRIVSFDMGGTTAKLCLIDEGRPQTSRQIEVARAARFIKGSGLPIRIPVIEMIEIGAGGGSIASVDSLGRIAVGPQSAGAEPGPACYRRGGERATVTDADLTLGYIDPGGFRRGPATARPGGGGACNSVGGGGSPRGERDGCRLRHLADGRQNMANAARIHAVERGTELGGRTLVAFGGNGPLHATRVAERIGVSRILVPPDPGVGSAVGFLSAPVSYEIVRSLYVLLDEIDAPAVDRLFRKMEAQAAAVVRAGAPEGVLEIRRAAFMRYRGQGHEIEVPVPNGALDPDVFASLRGVYDERYAALFGRVVPEMVIEIMNWSSVVSTGSLAPVVVPQATIERVPEACGIRAVRVGYGGETVQAQCYRREALAPGRPYRRTGAGDRGTDHHVCLPGLHGDGRWRGEHRAQSTQRNRRLKRAHCPAFRDREPGGVEPLARGSRGAGAGAGAHRVQPDRARVRRHLRWHLRSAWRDARAGGDRHPGTHQHHGGGGEVLHRRLPHRAISTGRRVSHQRSVARVGTPQRFMLVQPVFDGDRPVGYVACTSHLLDLGGLGMGPQGSDIFDEGLLVPPSKLVDAGRINELLVRLVRANSRSPVENEGDLYALIACCNVGAERLVRMMRDFGLDRLDHLSRYIIETSERATRAAIRAVPNGVYESCMWSDGYDFEIELVAALTVGDEDMRLDLTGSSPCSRFGINVPINYTTAYCVFGIRCIVSPEIPNNAGSLSPFRVTAPPGCILNAQHPAPVAMRHSIGQLMPDLVFGCLHQALPDAVPAEGASCMWDLPLRGGYGAAGSNNATSFAAELTHNGGTGARPSKDGLSATAYPSGVWGSRSRSPRA